MNIQFKKGVLELVVLNEIARNDQYGYELSQNIQHELSIADGTLYPMLRRLVQDGHLETYMGKTSGGPARKYYSITDTGKDHLNHLIREWEDLKVSVENLISRGGKYNV
ncbi:PadR family transcriptional regulator [Macrococcus capreoli]|uniref:PadR family transcriptional regulator n=1 Tax=Macrococcus capreoli TaxID=2982690 RepID=UPI0021D59AEC|nr:PadR family transcriptional regulator [Macrococcus sp. TMW 2.2395]MCU7558204.1 PadR family transcriptional regulator [Macrococcus sp. TMW 2.2395]